jgi:dienelactone hydrolase
MTLASMDREGAEVPVAAHLLKPAGDGPFAAVVMLHGAIGGLGPGYLCIAERLVGWGYVVLAIDSNSAASRNRLQSLGSYLDTEQAQDAHQGRNFLTTLPYVDAERVALVGWSAGGQAALAALSDHRSFHDGKWFSVDKAGRFAAAVALYPVCYPRLENLQAPLLILIGANDQTVSARYCQFMSKNVGRGHGPKGHEIELKIYPDARHGFDGPLSGWQRRDETAADARLRIRAFLAQHLR